MFVLAVSDNKQASQSTNRSWKYIIFLKINNIGILIIDINEIKRGLYTA